jgi:hypothetical protein
MIATSYLEYKMLVGIIFVSVLVAAGFCASVASIVGIIFNFRKNNEKVRTNVIRLVLFSVSFALLGGLNAILIIKYAFDNKEKIANTADKMIIQAIDKTAEYTVRSIIVTASTYSKAYNSNIIKQFENLDIRYLSETSETSDGKKVYEIELEFNNNIPLNEQLYLGNIISSKYLLACDSEDYVYEAVPMETGAFTDHQGLISLFEFIFNRDYTKYGHILRGKTKQKILVSVPENVDIAYLRFLDRKIEKR